MITLNQYIKKNWKDKKTLLDILHVKGLIDENGIVSIQWQKEWLENWKYMGNTFIKTKTDKIFNDIFSIEKELIDIDIQKQEKVENSDFRKEYRAEYRTQDWHYVRSRAEVIIDDWLFNNNIIHIYEKKLPIAEDVYTDFFLPSHNIYIEFWWLENDIGYIKRKEIKRNLYIKHNFKLIEINDKELENINDVLTSKLISFWIEWLT